MLAHVGQNTVVHAPFAAVRKPGAVKKLTGVDVRGFRHSMSNQSAAHVLKKHGNPHFEALRGQLAITRADIARAPEIVRLGTYQAAQQRPFGPKRIEIVAKLDDATFHYVGEIRPTQRRIDMVSMWKR